jgi:DNA helicase-2/ATP-dependent DNA helicase PcrA
MIYSKLGYTLDDETKKILLNVSQHKLVLAPAGGTKTTLAQVYVILEKIKRVVQAAKKNREGVELMNPSFNREQILCIVYNNHNTSDIELAHSRIYRACESLGVVSRDMNKSERYSQSEILAKTLHSLALGLVSDNKEYLKLRLIRQLPEKSARIQLSTIAFKILGTDVSKYNTVLKELYDLYSNLCLYEEEAENNSVFREQAEQKVDIPLEVLVQVFQRFDKQKDIQKMYEFSDWIKLAIKLMKIKEIADAIHKKYKIIVADEIQDFTKLMFQLYALLISNEAKTFAIGDSDQTIYEFNGASPDNIDKYNELVNINAVRFDMVLNRRCRENTFTYPNAVINSVFSRSRMPIKTVKTGGRFVTLTYDNYNDEVNQIIEELEKVSYNTTAVLFRKKADAIPLSRRLIEDKISASYINAIPFVGHHLYVTFCEAVKSVFLNRGRETWKNLFKFMPFIKEQLSNFLKLDAEEYPEAFPDYQDWQYLDFTPLMSMKQINPSVINQVVFLKGVARRVMDLPAHCYMQLLYDMFYHNYYKHIAAAKDLYSDAVAEWLVKDLSAESSLRQLMAVLDNTSRLVVYDKIKPITVSTMHGSKGLEFDRVIIANMESESKEVGFAPLENELDAEKRLYYVASTRQRDCLVLCGSKDAPHRLFAESFIANNSVKVENSFNSVSDEEVSGILKSGGFSKMKPAFTLGGVK